MLSKIFNLRSKWLVLILIGIIVGISLIIGYIKFYHIDSHYEQLDQLYGENKSLKTQIGKLENGYKSLNNNITTLQTQMTHGVLLETPAKVKLQYKVNPDYESTESSVNVRPTVQSRPTPPAPQSQQTLMGSSQSVSAPTSTPTSTPTPKPVSVPTPPMETTMDNLSKKELEKENQIQQSKSIEATIDEDIERMFDEADDNHDQPDEHEEINQIIITNESPQSLPKNIIQTNDDISSSILDLNEFKQEVSKSNEQIQMLLDDKNEDEEIETKINHLQAMANFDEKLNTGTDLNQIKAEISAEIKPTSVNLEMTKTQPMSTKKKISLSLKSK